MKEITEGEAREVLGKLYLNALGGIGMGQFKNEKDILSTLITRYFLMERRLTSDSIARKLQSYSIATGDSPIKDVLKASEFLSNVLTGKGEE